MGRQKGHLQQVPRSCFSYLHDLAKVVPKLSCFWTCWWKNQIRYFYIWFEGVLKSNKSNLLYSAENYTVSLSSSRDGRTVISGHLDGSVFAYSMENQSFKKIFTHHSIPYALGFGENIMAAGNDQKVTFYDTYGNVLQRFDYSHEDKVKDFTVAAFNPSGETVVLGNFNRFYVYNLNGKRGQWEEITCKTI